MYVGIPLLCYFKWMEIAKNAENHRLFKILKKKHFAKLWYLCCIFVRYFSTLHQPEKEKKIFIKYAINLILQFIFLLLNIFFLHWMALAYMLILKWGFIENFRYTIFFHSSHYKKFNLFQLLCKGNEDGFSFLNIFEEKLT